MVSNLHCNSSVILTFIFTCGPTTSFLLLKRNWFHSCPSWEIQTWCVSVIDGEWSGVVKNTNKQTHTCPHPGALHTKGRSSPISDKCSERKRKKVNFLKVGVNVESFGYQIAPMLLYLHPLRRYVLTVSVPRSRRAFENGVHNIRLGRRPTASQEHLFLTRWRIIRHKQQGWGSRSKPTYPMQPTLPCDCHQLTGASMISTWSATAE